MGVSSSGSASCVSIVTEEAGVTVPRTEGGDDKGVMGVSDNTSTFREDAECQSSKTCNNYIVCLCIY